MVFIGYPNWWEGLCRKCFINGIAIKGSIAQKSKNRTKQIVTGWPDGLFMK